MTQRGRGGMGGRYLTEEEKELACRLSERAGRTSSRPARDTAARDAPWRICG